MFSTSERTAMIARVQQFPSMLETAVSGLTDEQLNTPYKPGGWTLRQVVHHLADAHINVTVRMKLILTEENPTLKTYEQDAWAELADVKGEITSSLLILRGVHERLSRLLRAVDESAWKRKAIHPERGEVDLDVFLKMVSDHGDTHLKHIREFRAAKNW